MEDRDGGRPGGAGAGRPGAVGERRRRVVEAAVRAGLVGPRAPLAGFVDADGVAEAVSRLHRAFGPEVFELEAPEREASGPEGTAGGSGTGRSGAPPEVLHTFAAKAASLVPVLRLLAGLGMGCEVASPGELAQALAAGFPPGRIVLDSPAKTRGELADALALGVAVNADSLAELQRVDALLDGAAPRSVVGLRVNPQVGEGSIGAMSTATRHSKFGVALRDEGAAERVVGAFADRPWLTRLHAHVGSQGCPLELIADGIRETYELAERINRELGRQQVTSLDIGGGLPVNFADDEVRPTFDAYAEQLRRTVPGLFSGRYGLVTEFGRSLLAKNGFIASVVEYVKSAGGRRIALTHAGAQIAVRTVFAPEAWPLRVGAYDAAGRPKRGPLVPQDVAGPCCFAGDLVARGRELPELEPGDVVVLYDTGAYYFSAHWTYNSLPRPPIHGFTTSGGAGGGGGPVRFTTVRAGQTIEDVVAESGLDRVGALVGLRGEAGFGEAGPAGEDSTEGTGRGAGGVGDAGGVSRPR